MVKRGYRGLQGVTGDCKGSHGLKGGFALSSQQLLY